MINDSYMMKMYETLKIEDGTWPKVYFHKLIYENIITTQHMIKNRKYTSKYDKQS